MTTIAPGSLDRQRDTFTPEAIERLVTAFYERVRSDPLLGPIFEARVADWPRHLSRMCAFWGTILRAEAGYRANHRGSPLQIHQAIEGLTDDHWERWLELFERTACEVFEQWAADEAVGRARRIAVALAGSRA